MKNLCKKKRNSKGKIHPSPSHSPSPSLSTLNLLPSAILTLTSVLSVDDQEVLAYLILRSLDTTNPSSSKCNNPTFYCGCFQCYTRFWIRWDSSPNRHLIHQAIDAFDDHLSLSDTPNKTHKPKNRNRRSSSLSASPEPETSDTVTSSSSPTPAATDCAEEYDDGAKELTGNRLQEVASVQQKGMERKVWPDVLGIFNSRLWSLWSPNA